MKTVIFDKGDGAFADKAAAAAKEMFGDVQVTVVGQFDPDPVGKLRAAALALGHLRAEDFESVIANPAPNLLIVMRVSSQGAGGMADSFKPPYRLNDTGPWILHLIERSGDVGTERWKEIFTAIQNWDFQKGELSSEVAAIFDPHPEARLALRLLCEAWLMNDGQQEKQHGDILIHAPVTPDDWISPFVENFNGRNAQEKDQTIEKQIANLMGNARSQVKLFYETLLKKDAPTITKDAVERLLGALKTAAAK